MASSWRLLTYLFWVTKVQYHLWYKCLNRIYYVQISPFMRKMSMRTNLYICWTEIGVGYVRLLYL